MNQTEKLISDHLRRKFNKAQAKWKELEQKKAKQEAIDDWQNYAATLTQVIEDIEYGHYKRN